MGSAESTEEAPTAEEIAVEDAKKEEEGLAKEPWAMQPKQQQVWAHGVCSRAALKKALADDKITAIEADILIGSVQGMDAKVHLSEDVPVMAHPPSSTSDLCFDGFLEDCVKDGNRHLKLDFKEISALQQCLPKIAKVAPKLLANGQAVWINADILPGPGKRFVGHGPVPAEEFFEAVLKHCPGIPLSLGFHLDPGSSEGYTKADCDNIQRHYQDYEKELAAAGRTSAGLTYALALRLVARATHEVQMLLFGTPGSLVLAWTGTAEPPVMQSVVTKVQDEFEKVILGERIYFDVKVAESFTQGCFGELGLRAASVCSA